MIRVDALEVAREEDFTLRRVDDGYDVEWFGLAKMHIGATVSFEPNPAVDASVIEKLRRGPAAGVARYLRRSGLAFHASAVRLADKGIVFSGESGAGKSTVAALLVRHGAQLLADDVAITRATERGQTIEPTESAHMLDARSRELIGGSNQPHDKVAVPATVAGDEATMALFVQLDARPLGLERLQGMAAMVAVARARVCPITQEPDRMREDFDNVSRLVACVPVYRVSHGNAGWEGLSRLLSSIEELG